MMTRMIQGKNIFVDSLRLLKLNSLLRGTTSMFAGSR